MRPARMAARRPAATASRWRTGPAVALSRWVARASACRPTNGRPVNVGRRPLRCAGGGVGSHPTRSHRQAWCRGGVAPCYQARRGHVVATPTAFCSCCCYCRHPRSLLPPCHCRPAASIRALVDSASPARLRQPHPPQGSLAERPRPCPPASPSPTRLAFPPRPPALLVVRPPGTPWRAPATTPPRLPTLSDDALPAALRVHGTNRLDPCAGSATFGIAQGQCRGPPERRRGRHRRPAVAALFHNEAGVTCRPPSYGRGCPARPDPHGQGRHQRRRPRRHPVCDVPTTMVRAHGILRCAHVAAPAPDRIAVFHCSHFEDRTPCGPLLPFPHALTRAAAPPLFAGCRPPRPVGCAAAVPAAITGTQQPEERTVFRAPPCRVSPTAFTTSLYRCSSSLQRDTSLRPCGA